MSTVKVIRGRSPLYDNRSDDLVDTTLRIALDDFR